MQTVTMMILKSCPYCRQALAMVEELRRERPEYAGVQVDVFDENEHKRLADSLDYYYVPTFFVGKKKMMEGVPSRDKVEAVFREALRQTPSQD